MPTRDHAPLGAPCWIELFTSDPDTTRAFYASLFGWAADEPDPEFGGYFQFVHAGAPMAGGMTNDGSQGIADGWNVYLATADAEAIAKSAVEHGGQVHMGPHPVAELGAMTWLSDPGGAMISAWQPGTHPGFTAMDEPGAPAWFEVHTHHYDEAVAFYQEVFGWDTDVMSDEDDFRYTTLGKGDDALAGIMDDAIIGSTDEAHWVIYFQVDDVDAAATQVRDLGGSVVDEPSDSPFGRLTTVTDPTGARFRIMAP